VRPLAPADQPDAPWPGRQVHVIGELGHPHTVPILASVTSPTST
jgi:hypothetical protein